MTGASSGRHVGGAVARLDVSGVPPQGSHVAKRCPLRVQYEVFPPRGVEAAPVADVVELRSRAAADFQAAVLAEVAARADGSSVVAVRHDRPRPLRVAETLLAMGEGALVVVGGLLPTDVLGRRQGGPDLLVRAERRPEGPWAYHPVEVRNHRTLDDGEPREPGAGALVAPIGTPWLASATRAADRTTRSRHGDRLSLAHQHRLLEQTPHGSADAFGAVIGTERALVWHQLDEPVVQHRWDVPHATRESTLERYDFEFAFRLAVLAAAALHEPAVGPVAVGECSGCPWRAHCGPRIEAADSTSLLPGFGYRQWYNLARAGIATRAELGALDLPTALVRDAFAGLGDLPAVVAAASALPPDTPVDQVLLHVDPDPDPDRAAATAAEGDGPGRAEVIGRQDAVLRAHGVACAADLVALDPVVVALVDQPVRRLAEAIQGARAQATGTPQLRHGVARLEVPSADVEIDIDMESGLDGTTYLWGAWADGAYHAFRSWASPSPEVEATVFAGFWAWLAERRRTAALDGRRVAVYCWFQGAESKALRRGAKVAAALLGLTDAPAEVEELLAGPDWVDLYQVFTSQLVTGTSAGLKVVATAAGFRWRDADPNGADSMAWHDEAVGDHDPARREAARARLLAYNEDDVRATVAVRHWMRTALGGVPVAPAPRSGPVPAPAGPPAASTSA